MLFHPISTNISTPQKQTHDCRFLNPQENMWLFSFHLAISKNSEIFRISENRRSRKQHREQAQDSHCMQQQDWDSEKQLKASPELLYSPYWITITILALLLLLVSPSAQTTHQQAGYCGFRQQTLSAVLINWKCAAFPLFLRQKHIDVCLCFFFPSFASCSIILTLKKYLVELHKLSCS